MKNNNKYKLLGFVWGTEITARILVLSTGKIIAMSLKDLDDSEISEDLNHHELKCLYKKMYSQTDLTTTYDIPDRNERSWYTFLTISIMLSVIYIISTVSGIKPIQIKLLNLIIPPAIFFYPLTFILVDMLNEFYGMKMARKSIFISFIANLFFVSGLWLTTLTPSIKEWPLNTAYQYFVSNMLSVLFASSLAYVISENVNSWLLCKIKSLTNSKYLFIRVMTSSFFAAIIDSVIFCTLAFYKTLSANTIKTMIVSQLIIKIIYAIGGIIPIYQTRKLFRKFIHPITP